jgi:hypothetical protein
MAFVVSFGDFLFPVMTISTRKDIYAVDRWAYGHLMHFHGIKTSI